MRDATGAIEEGEASRPGQNMKWQRVAAPSASAGGSAAPPTAADGGDDSRPPPPLCRHQEMTALIR
eukprot:8033789-Alexandrium_andersonii.AAC.1